MTTGVAFLDPKARLMLSPDGNSLVTVSETQVDWYAVDWENAVLQLVAEKVSPTKISDAVFNRDSSLLVREEGTKLVRLYGFSGGSLIENFATLSLPDNVHILHVVE
jgi:hypothetical protein